MPTAHFQGRRVLSLESRRATEVATLISKYGGRPVVAPALRELPLESNTAAIDFAAALLLGDIDMGIFLTGVGVRAIADVFAQAHPGEEIRQALSRIKVAVRGPKPAAVFRELNVPIWVTAPEPNTWRELLAAIEARAAEMPLAGARVAVQEYGVPNQQLIDALIARGASVLPVPVYKWALPEDLDPLRRAVAAVAGRGIDVLLLTSGVQLAHLWQVVEMMAVRRAVPLWLVVHAHRVDWPDDDRGDPAPRPDAGPRGLSSEAWLPDQGSRGAVRRDAAHRSLARLGIVTGRTPTFALRPPTRSALRRGRLLRRASRASSVNSEPRVPNPEPRVL